QTQARSVAAAGTRVCNLLPAGDRLFRAAAHVGHNSVSAVVLLRLRLHGRDEHPANGERQAIVCFVASSEECPVKDESYVLSSAARSHFAKFAPASYVL